MWEALFFFFTNQMIIFFLFLLLIYLILVIWTVGGYDRWEMMTNGTIRRLRKRSSIDVGISLRRRWLFLRRIMKWVYGVVFRWGIVVVRELHHNRWWPVEVDKGIWNCDGYRWKRWEWKRYLSFPDPHRLKIRFWAYYYSVFWPQNKKLAQEMNRKKKNPQKQNDLFYKEWDFSLRKPIS